MSELIAGRNPVLEALSSMESGGRAQLEKIVILKGTSGSVKKIEGRAKALGVPLVYAGNAAFERILREAYAAEPDAEPAVHQGVLAYASAFAYAAVADILSLSEKRNEAPLIVILDGIEDPHNLGAIMRSAEGAGAHGVIIPKRRAAMVNATAVKASAGASEHILCARVPNIAQTIEKLKEENIWVYACDMGGPEYYSAELGSGGIALVIGNEGSGISRLVREKCDGVLSIPMHGRVQSLNASNAAAILLYEVLRQREAR